MFIIRQNKRFVHPFLKAFLLYIFPNLCYNLAASQSYGTGPTVCRFQKGACMNLPKDPVILLSYINTQLRDNYASLAEFCSANDCSPEEIVRTIREAVLNKEP